MSKPADKTETAKTAEQEAAAKEAEAKAAAEQEAAAKEAEAKAAAEQEAAAKEAEAKAAAKQDAAKDKPAELKPWQLEEWTGPLTADQAAWRREHIKPVGEVKTK